MAECNNADVTATLATISLDISPNGMGSTFKKVVGHLLSTDPLKGKEK